MSRIFFLLLLVGAIYAQESGDDSQEEIISDTDAKSCDGEQCENSDNSEIESMNEQQLEEIQNIPVVFDKEMTQSKICPPGKAKCSYWLFNSLQTYSWAWRFCYYRNGRFSSVHNSYTNRILARTAAFTNRRSNFAWIGLLKRCHSKYYRWVDGTRFNYSNWARGQPKRCGTWCTAMNVHSGQWFSVHCNTRLPFFCTF